MDISVEKKLNLIGKMAISIVHDLKNPMATIQTLLEMANVVGISDDERRKTINMIQREVLRMSDMAYEILDFVKEKMVLNLEEVNLDEFIKEIYTFLEIDFQYAGVEFDLDLEYRGAVTFDSDKIRRVFINLARNSLEAMYDKKRSYKFIVRSIKQDSHLKLSFIDNGPGLPISIRDKLFKNFVTQGKPNGTGIGLYMAKATMEAHGGTIEYHTEDGVGTTFTLSFSLEGKNEKNINR